MQLLNAEQMNRVAGGMMNGSPGTGNKNMYMDPNSHVDVSLKVGNSSIEFHGTAGQLAAGWQGLKNAAVSAGWTAAQGVTLVEAGFACDFHSDWSVCRDAQDQVDFVLDQVDQ